MYKRWTRILSIALFLFFLMAALNACITVNLPASDTPAHSAALSQSAAQIQGPEAAQSPLPSQSAAENAPQAGSGAANTGGSGKVEIPGDFNDKSIINTGIFKLAAPYKLNDAALGRILGDASGGSGGEEASPPFALTAKDMDTPVLAYIGRGYDVFENYASGRYVKEGRFLDLDKLIKDGKVFRDTFSESDYKEVTSSSARSYATSVATRVNLSGKYLFFAGSVTTNFSTNHLEKADHFFSTIFYKISLYSLYIDPSVDLKQYVRKEAQDILETRDAQWIFENYGTHVVRSLQAGGRMDYNTSIDKRYVEDESSFSANVKSSFNNGFASAKVSVETSSTTTTQEFMENRDVRIFTYGGDGIDGRSMEDDPQALKIWKESVKTTPSISDFGDNALIPIWEFCKTAERKQYLEEAFDTYAEGKLQIVPSSFAVNGLRLNIVKVSEPVINSFTDESGEWHLVSNISAHTMLPGDQMAILYCRYGRADDPDRPPVVEIILENATEQEDARAYFEEKYKNDPAAQLFGWNGTHNIEGSNLGRSINQQTALLSGAPEMYLYYVTSTSAAPIKSVIVRYVNGKGETSYSPYAPEQGKKYEQILDKTLQKSGKIMAQDTGEGAKDYYATGFPICKNHFIEYTRD